MGTASIYERLGGKDVMDRAVDRFYERVLADQRVRHFFEDVDMDAQRAKQKAFLTFALGGPIKYTGKELRDAHAHLVVRGLTDTHFVAVCENLIDTLKELGVSPPVVVEVLEFLESTRADVLGR